MHYGYMYVCCDVLCEYLHGYICCEETVHVQMIYQVSDLAIIIAVAL